VRVIAGSLKGRRLVAPAGSAVRPTSDSLRETLFNVLADSVAGAHVLDAFAGTGALGIEALSRGAAAVTFVERDARIIRTLEDNLRHCGVEKACVIIRHDFLSTRPSDSRFDLVLADPPYDLASLDNVIVTGERWMSERGRLVLEHSRRRATPERAGELRRYRLLTAGDSALSFYERTTPPSEA
jgi:16S rRNA (guanine966-N2)-methyltransferase